MKITEDVRKYAAEHGLTNEEAIESGMQEKRKEFVESRRRSLREDVMSGERTLPACWFRHLAETNFSECLWDNTSFRATNIASLRALGLDLAA